MRRPRSVAPLKARMASSVQLGPPWPAELSELDRTCLNPGRGEGLPRRPDVLVVGGGIVGTATAAACVRAGLGSVVLLERSSLASGVTGSAAGLLIPDAHRGTDPDHFVELGRSSLALWRGLHAEIPGGVGLVDIDWIGLEPHPAVLAANRSSGAETLSADQVAQVVPDLAHPVPGLRVRQGRVNPVRAVARLAGSLHQKATLVSGVAVETALTRAGRLLRLGTSDGTISPGAVVFATGEPPGIDGLGVELPSRRVKGHLLLTDAAGLAWPGSVAPLATNIGDGRLLMGGTLDIGDQSPEVSAVVIAEMRSYLDRAVPRAAAITTSNAWCCFRPAHPDGLPVVDQIPGLANAWITSGHYRTGILMGPATGEALAGWIATGEMPSAVKELSARRFASP